MIEQPNMTQPATDEAIDRTKRAMLFERDSIKAKCVTVDVDFVLTLIARIEQQQSEIATLRLEIGRLDRTMHQQHAELTSYHNHDQHDPKPQFVTDDRRQDEHH